MDTKPVQKRLKFWGWGYEDEVVPASELEWMESTWAKRFGVSSFTAVPTPNASLVCQARHCEGAYHHVHERSRDGQTGVPERAASAGGPRLRAARPLTPALPGNLLIARVQA